jgi:hypothetical protein
MLTIVEYLCPFLFGKRGGDGSAENGRAFGYLYE